MKLSQSFALVGALALLSGCGASTDASAPVSSSTTMATMHATVSGGPTSSATSSAIATPSSSKTAVASRSATPSATKSFNTTKTPNSPATTRTPVVTEDGVVQNPQANAPQNATASATASKEDLATGQPVDGSMPAGATQVTSVQAINGTRVATLVTPSGNIGCDIYQGQGIGCGVKSLADSAPQVPGQMKIPGWYFYTPAQGATYDTGRTDPGLAMISAQSQVVPYGTSVYFDRYLCQSETAGLRCTNIDTKHGMYLNRSGVTTF